MKAQITHLTHRHYYSLRSLLSGIIGSLLLIPAHSFAQVCNTKQVAETISIRNFINPDTLISLATSSGPTAKDINSNLTWDRCIYGQQWNYTTQQCDGSPVLLSWPEALQKASVLGWRVPNIKELNSILNMQCTYPPFDLAIFPGTPVSEDHGLWTSSPHIGDVSGSRTNAWYIDLGPGLLNYRDAIDEKTKNFVKFVK